MVELLGENKHAAVILNSCDLYAADVRNPLCNQEITLLASLGITSEELDLRRFFNTSDQKRQLKQLLGRFGLVWVRGGNSFVLRRAMKASGFDEIICELLERDEIVWGGYSAGIVVLTPSLHGIELVDDAHTVPPGYPGAIVWDCLQLLPYAFAPHYKSDHPESADVDRSVEYFIDNHIPFVALRDGEAMVVNGEASEVIS
jgi:dipeptidase E